MDLIPALLGLIIILATIYFISYINTSAPNIPPGPRGLPVVGNLLSLRSSLFNLSPVLRRLRAVYGPILTLRFGKRLAIFVSDRALAHKILVAAGADAAGRLPSGPAASIMNSHQHNISSATYGPLWRLLRRNLMSEILNSSRVKSYSKARAWVLDVLLSKLESDSSTVGSVRVGESFQYSLFCLLLLMCFGEKLEEKQVREIEAAQRTVMLSFTGLNVLGFFPGVPGVAKFLFRTRRNELLEIRKGQEDCMVPLIRARMEKLKKGAEDVEEQSFVFSYVDSLFKLELPEEGHRKLTEGEIVTLCSEFINSATDTTTTALHWVMANLVKYPEIQSKLAEEIESVIDPSSKYIGEEDLQKLPYLKAVVMEGLRRHPPGHFLLPHTVKEDLEVDGYVIPKNAALNFLLPEMGWDEHLWEEPMEFRPERFLGKDVDITGTKEIKMMPFGAGRRICPGLNLAMLLLEWFVANLVREYEWKAKDGDEIDFAEKPGFTMMMKKPLEAVITPKMKKATNHLD